MHTVDFAEVERMQRADAWDDAAALLLMLSGGADEQAQQSRPGGPPELSLPQQSALHALASYLAHQPDVSAPPSELRKLKKALKKELHKRVQELSDGE